MNNYYKKSFWSFLLPALLLKIGLELYLLGFILNSIPSLADSKISNGLLNIAVPMLFWGLVLAVPLGLLAKWFSKKARRVNNSNEQTTFTQSVTWAALLCPFVWSLTNKLNKYLLLSLIPVYNVYLGGKLALYGRGESWGSGKWNDFIIFKKKQKSLRWKIPLAYIIVAFVGILIAAIFAAVTTAQDAAQGFGKIFEAFFTILSNWRH